MPRIDVRKTKRVFLPSTKDLSEADQAWVDLYTDITVGETAAINEMNLDDVSEGIEILKYLISDWNFTEDGTANTSKIEISHDNVAKLNKDDYIFLSNFYTKLHSAASEGLSQEEKKVSTGSSTQESDKPKSQPITINYNS